MIGPFCCEEGRSEGDFLGGTAAEVSRWLLLEYPGPWGRDAIEDNDLPASLRYWLERELASVPRSRLLFIRRAPAERGLPASTRSTEPAPEAPGSLFVVEGGGSEAGVRELRFECYEDLAEIELERSLPVPSGARMLLTCTNARRDRCCAKFGVPVYQKLRELAPDLAWECTHTGGHRYAASVLSLPEGAYYGFLDEAIAPRLVEAHRAGRLLLDHYRGRSFHPRPVQAADVWLRREEGIFGLDDVRWVSCEPMGESPLAWRVVLEIAGGTRISLDVNESVRQKLTSCSPQKRKDSVSFHVVRSPSDRDDIL